jgi:hypothetical protein
MPAQIPTRHLPSIEKSIHSLARQAPRQANAQESSIRELNLDLHKISLK